MAGKTVLKIFQFIFIGAVLLQGKFYNSAAGPPAYLSELIKRKKMVETEEGYELVGEDYYYPHTRTKFNTLFQFALRVENGSTMHGSLRVFRSC